MTSSDSLSMASGEGPIAQVQEGMRVIDSAGQEIGNVSLVRMGNPEVVTLEGEASGNQGILAGVANAFAFWDEPDLPPTLQARLMRYGFINIDGEDLFSKDRYVRAAKIAGVSTATVRLNVPKERVAEEA